MMAKKFFTKALSVGLSLTLCAGLVAPALAASFTDLQDAIDGKSDKTEAEAVSVEEVKNDTALQTDGTKFKKDNDETDYFGYAWDAVKQWFGIEAWEGTRNVLDNEGNETGDTTETRHVQLNENVEFDVSKGDSTTGVTDRWNRNVTVADSIMIGAEQDVTLDLNGMNVNLVSATNAGQFKGGNAIAVAENGTLTIQNSNDQKMGKIKGGANPGCDRIGYGVENEGALILESGEIGNGGDGYGVGNYGKFLMTGGAIKDADGTSLVRNDGEFTMTGGEIGNSETGDCYVGVWNNGKFTMTGGKISNIAYCGAGENSTVYNSGEFIMTGGELSNNDSQTVIYGSGGTFTMTGGTIKDNTNSDFARSWGATLKGSARWLVYNEDNGDIMQEYVVPEDGKVPWGVKLKFAQMDEDGNIIVPVGKTVIDKDGKEWGEDELPFGGKIDKDGKVIPNPDPNAVPTPTPVTRITDPAIPLADGPVTRAQFIDYLWRHEGEPASNGACTFTDVAEDHEYFDALCWADENGVAEAYFGVEGHEDGTFEPDELVTVGAVREFLGSFETVFGAQAVAAADLATLTGEDGEAVLNCGEVLAEFFGEEYAPAEAEDELAA